jgi:hypothetical protein
VFRDIDGRPRTLKPWLVCNPPMSRATWYRRQKAEAREK